MRPETCADCDNPFAVPIPDDWGPEQADVVIGFLEAVLDTLHRNYDLSIIAMRNDRWEACRPVPAAPTARDDDPPF